MAGSRQKEGNPKNDEFYTPKFIFDALGCKFDMDVASPLNNQTNVPADIKLTEKENGLETKWEGFVWMNPPFSKPSPWVTKFINHNNGIGLVQVSKGQWFNELWDKAETLLLLPPRFKFDRPDSLRSDIFMPLVLFSFGFEGNRAVANSGLGKVR